MALAGAGVLAIWNGIAPEAEAEFVSWHVREHIPERVGLPGFLRGRRYVALEGAPRYFNFYETEGVGALTSAAYKARLDAPTEWTRRVVRHFTDTSRTVCEVAASLGAGEGGWILTLRLEAGSYPEGFAAAVAEGLLRPAQEQPGLVAAHLLRGEAEASSGRTAENAARAKPDEIVGWVILVEAVDPAPLRAVSATLLADDRLAAAGAAGRIQRGIYGLQFALSQEGLRR